MIGIKQTIQDLSQAYTAHLVEYRRHLHANPELSFQEAQTQQYLLSVLHKAGIQTQTFADSYAVVARIKGEKPGKTVAFRADIDALCLQEENDAAQCPYHSRNDGVMHACGHDGHTAVLLVLAEVFAAHPELIAGEVVLIFQNAEEMLPGGAKRLVECGVLEDVDEIYGAHIWTSYDVGTVVYAPREMMAAADMFQVEFTGKGGHGSQPHFAQDVLLAGCTAAEQMQTIVSRSVSALETAVLSVCQLNCGTAFNVISDKAELRGTVRTFSEPVQELIIQRIEEISQSVAKMYRTGCKVDYTKGYPALINHPEVVQKAVQAISRFTEHTLVETPPVMVGEDYSYYLQKKPGAFFFIGCRNLEKKIECAMHSSSYRMDEQALNVALESFLAVYLGGQEA